MNERLKLAQAKYERTNDLLQEELNKNFEYKMKFGILDKS